MGYLVFDREGQQIELYIESGMKLEPTDSGQEVFLVGVRHLLQGFSEAAVYVEPGIYKPLDPGKTVAVLKEIEEKYEKK